MNNKYDDVRAFFNDHYECFTIYVVEKLLQMDEEESSILKVFGKENYINTDSDAKKLIEKILLWTHKKHIPQIASIITNLSLKNFSPTGIQEICNGFKSIVFS